MKVSDYIVEFLIQKGISDVFGYPGGMITHLMQSFYKYSDKISAHVMYNEQSASFAACGYAQTSGKLGVAYATSGPGATNLITGIANAFFDSIPTLFITGQINTFESKKGYKVRQRGFQETDIVSIVSGITKYSVYVESSTKIKYYLERAYFEALNGRKGPILLDIPMDILCSEVEPCKLSNFIIPPPKKYDVDRFRSLLISELSHSKYPCILLGNGVKIAHIQDIARNVVQKLGIPCVTSMVAFDVLENSANYFGFIGTYGHRAANFIVAKSDLIIALGSRLDIRQVGFKRDNFAPKAQIIRVDIDEGEFSNPVHGDELQINLPLENAFEVLNKIEVVNYFSWLDICTEVQKRVSSIDNQKSNEMIKALSQLVPENAIITTDVGQNQVWVAQSFLLKKTQKVLFSGGHGAMGYSFPAAIGAYYGSGKSPIVSINGDGGFQMNIQELQFIVRERLPMKIIIINNHALGMIRHFQEMYFNKNYYQTVANGGYSVPDFCKIAKAYGIKTKEVSDLSEVEHLKLDLDEALLVNVDINENTYVFPKLEFGKPNQDQEPLLDRSLFNKIMNLNEVDVGSYVQ